MLNDSVAYKTYLSIFNEYLSLTLWNVYCVPHFYIYFLFSMVFSLLLFVPSSNFPHLTAITARAETQTASKFLQRIRSLQNTSSTVLTRKNVSFIWNLFNRKKIKLNSLENQVRRAFYGLHIHAIIIIEKQFCLKPSMPLNKQKKNKI